MPATCTDLLLRRNQLLWLVPRRYIFYIVDKNLVLKTARLHWRCPCSPIARFAQDVPHLCQPTHCVKSAYARFKLLNVSSPGRVIKKLQSFNVWVHMSHARRLWLFGALQGWPYAGKCTNVDMTHIRSFVLYLEHEPWAVLTAQQTDVSSKQFSSCKCMRLRALLPQFETYFLQIRYTAAVRFCVRSLKLRVFPRSSFQFSSQFPLFTLPISVSLTTAILYENETRF